MANRIKGITIELSGDTTGLDKALKSVNNTIKSTQAQLKDVDRLLKMDPKNTELLAQKQRLLTQEIDATKEKLATLKEAAKQAQDQLAKGEISQQQFDALQREIVETEQKLQGMEGELKDTNNAMSETSEKSAKFEGAMQAAGKAAMAAAAAIAAVGAAAYKAAKELDEGYDTIVAKTGATGERLEELKGTANDIFGDLPTDMATVGDAVGEVSTRFKLSGDQLKETSEQFIKFAKLNNTDVSSSIDTVQKAMAAFGVGTEDTGKVLDTLNAVGQETGINMQALSSTLTTNASTMKEMGFDFAQSAEFLGKLEVSGVDASQALTGLRMAMKNGAAQGKDINTVLAELDENMKNASSDQEAMNAAIELFGGRAGPALAGALKDGTISFTDLANSTKSLDDSMGNVNKTFEATISPWDKVKTAANKLKVGLSDFSQLPAALEEVIPEMLELVEDLVTQLAENAPEIIVAIVNAIVNNLPKLISAAVKIITSLAQGLSTSIPKLIPVMLQAVNTIVNALIQNMPLLINAAGQLIGGLVKGIVQNLPQIVRAAWEIIKTIGDLFKPSTAIKWGKDMIAGLVQGLTDNLSLSSIANGAKTVAGKIASFLHFSAPDEGPLADYMTFMPDFIEGLTNSLVASEYKLTDAVSGLASDRASEMTINPNAGINSSLASIQGLLSRGNVIVLDTGELVGATAKAYNAEFGKIARLEAAT